jgi:hydroxymethylglutaryl-CoA reductase (NADPH)
MNTFVNFINTNTDGQWVKNMERTAPIELEQLPSKHREIDERWQVLLQNSKYTQQSDFDPKEAILDKESNRVNDVYKDCIENYIGTVKVPLGLAGPLRVNGLHAHGDYYIPMATSEAALVASTSRGISCLNQSGGCTTAVILEGISRDPVFVFNNLIEVGQFLAWSEPEFTNYKREAGLTIDEGKLVEVKYMVEGRDVHLKCVYATKDGSGQSMIIVATENIVDYIIRNTPVKPVVHYLEGGMSGDKKATRNVMGHVRGRKVVAEVLIPEKVVKSILHVTPWDLFQYANLAHAGLVAIGTFGLHAHIANAITAMHLALGQDTANVAEGHNGLARGEMTKDNNIYFTVTLPNIVVATWGGGCDLPSQRACLELMGLYGKGNGNALAEVYAGVILASDLSLVAAITSGDFAKAHKILARNPIMSDQDSLDTQFDKAQAMVVKLSIVPSKDEIMNIYACYKQATVGDINIERPSFISTDFKAKAKYDAWANAKGMSSEAAKKEYIRLALELNKK